MAKHKKIVYTVLAIPLLAGIMLFLETRQVINLFPNKTSFDGGETTSTTKTAQSNFTGSNERIPGNTLNENKGSGGITDSRGELSSNVDTANPIVSRSGEITLFNPKQDNLLTKGVEIAGESKLSRVSYRLIDEVSGVISTGELSVNNGRFSGKIDFETSADKGRLDFYGTKDDGSEFSNIEVAVRFK